VSRDDFYASPLGSAYSAYMERPWLSRRIGRLVWGGNTGAYYESMGAIGEVTPGGTIVDCPCGAGPAFRALGPGAEVRYVAADLSPSMLRRARERAAARGLEGIEFVEADATDLPLETGSADLFLSYWGMHCFEDPRGAIAEIGRVLKPGGRLVGAAILNEPGGLRQRFLIRPHAPGLGRMCDERELRDWLAEAGLAIAGIGRSGPFAFFDARAEERREAPAAGGSVELGDEQP
jgi:SAM-dependent methyltransferase